MNAMTVGFRMISTSSNMKRSFRARMASSTVLYCACVCVCLCVCVYSCVFEYVCVCVCVRERVNVRARTHVCMTRFEGKHWN